MSIVALSQGYGTYIRGDSETTAFMSHERLVTASKCLVLLEVFRWTGV